MSRDSVQIAGGRSSQVGAELLGFVALLGQLAPLVIHPRIFATLGLVKLKLFAVALAVVAAGIVYLVVFADRAPGTADPLDQNRRACGEADALEGDQLEACVQLAYDLMGRANVAMQDDAARALLKKTCDQAFESGCTALRRFDATKLEFLERRCDGSSAPPDAAACVDVARRYESGIGTEPRPQVARAWYSKACKLGAQAACDKAAGAAH